MSNPYLAKINTLTQHFYDTHALSFSATRNAPWKGWEAALPEFQKAAENATAQQPMQVLDIGSGNLRFESYLDEAFPPSISIDATCIDSCSPLMESVLDEMKMEPHPRLIIQPVVMDVITELSANTFDASLASETNTTAFDLAVAFGFMHHIPTYQERLELLETMVAHTRVGGIVVISFWQFAHHESLHAKALRTTEEANDRFDLSLDPRMGDYALFWQDDNTVPRYCHHFSEDEIDRLTTSLFPYAKEVKRFSADGRTNDLNRYVIWEVTESTQKESGAS